DLLIPAERAAAEARHRQPESLAEHLPGGPGREELMTGQQVAVELGPLVHVLLAAVVRDERDPPLRTGFEVAVVGCHTPQHACHMLPQWHTRVSALCQAHGHLTGQALAEAPWLAANVHAG